MIAISSAIARGSQRLARRLWAPRSTRRRALRAERPALYPESRSLEAIEAFYASLAVAMISAAMLIFISGLGVVGVMQLAGVDQHTIDAVGRWLWAVFMSPLLYGGYTGILCDIAEHPQWWRFVPRPMRTPSDLHLLLMPITGVVFFFVVNPWLGDAN